ncbi:MAG TPA: hypothetical protein VKX28_31165 [Xanthobacteraceae bacterium]|nr:hypothetical protein [Xanthobacteraceae bacterium]
MTDDAASPTAAIVAWLRGQDAEIQAEIADLMLMVMRDDFIDLATNDVDTVVTLIDSLEADAPTYRVVGKAVIFRSVFDFLFAKRFTDAGWVDSEEMLRSAIKEGSSDHDSDAAKIAPSAFRMLRGLPGRRESWKAIGESYSALVQEYLTDEAIGTWQLQQ